MRILAISAYYPPYSYGGYEIRVSNVMDALSARGHEIHVLTTKTDTGMQAERIAYAYPVLRVLNGASRKMRFSDRLTTHHLTHGIGVVLVFLRETFADMRDLERVEREIRTFQPDLIYLGHIMPLSQELLPFLARQDLPIAADEGYSSLIFAFLGGGLWRRFLAEFPEDTFFQHLIKRSFVRVVSWLSRGRMQEERHWPAIHAFFNSELNAHNAHGAGVPLARAEVIHSGIDTDFFSFKRPKAFGNPLTLLQPGRIEQNKGQLDAVELCAALHARGIPCTLTIVGDRWKEIYAQEVENRIRELGLNSSVRILPMQSRSTLVKLYHQADICLFLSRYRSGFSRIPLEAMACGSLLLSYGYEGSDEILRDGQNGFLIPNGDIPAIAERISALLREPELISRIIHQARADIENEYSLSSYASKIEVFLEQVLQSKAIINQTEKNNRRRSTRVELI